MDKDYFNSLKNSVQGSEQPMNNTSVTTDQTLLTVKIDIDCKIYCDGSFLDLLEANHTKQFSIELGPHLITIESEHFGGLCEDREIDAKGRNNLLLIRDMKLKEQEYLQKQEEEKRSNEKNSELEKLVHDFKEKERECRYDIIQKTTTKIEYISHDKLFDLFATAMNGSSYLSAEYDKEFYNTIPKDKRKGECYEDKIADVLLNGGTIYVFVHDSEGKTYGNPNDCEVIKKDDEVYTKYKVTLDKIVRGLEHCADGTYNINEDERYVRDCFIEFADRYCDYFDITMADALMQVILFDERIYD